MRAQRLVGREPDPADPHMLVLDLDDVPAEIIARGCIERRGRAHQLDVDDVDRAGPDVDDAMDVRRGRRVVDDPARGHMQGTPLASDRIGPRRASDDPDGDVVERVSVVLARDAHVETDVEHSHARVLEHRLVVRLLLDRHDRLCRGKRPRQQDGRGDAKEMP